MLPLQQFHLKKIILFHFLPELFYLYHINWRNILQFLRKQWEDGNVQVYPGEQ